jgi:hypothetical protein
LGEQDANIDRQNKQIMQNTFIDKNKQTRTHLVVNVDAGDGIIRARHLLQRARVEVNVPFENGHLDAAHVLETLSLVRD